MVDNYIVKSFIKMKITELKNELKVANRYWKSRVQGELKAYETVSELLELQTKANMEQSKPVEIDQFKK